MKSQSFLSKLLAVFIFSVIALTAQAQDKNIAKVDELIAKARQATDPAKKTDLYNKAAELIMSARLSKDQYMKIADSYLEEGDITNALKYYGRCDKAEKNEGFIKVGYKMIETAFDDPKNEAKTVKKAIDYFTKAGAAAEGYETAGDAYYERGKSHYMKAAEYYGMGKITGKIEKVAREFLAENKHAAAAEVYMKLDNPEGYQKAGDLYFSAKDYNNAFTAYEKGGIADGIKKYADILYENGQTAEADAQYTKVAEMYATQKNYDAIIAMAKTADDRGNYGMAADFYQKAGEANKAARVRAYEVLFSFDFTGAKEAFDGVGDADMSKAITANMKTLTLLKDAASYFEEVKRNQPQVFYSEDPETKERKADKADLESFNSYYQDAAGSIVDNCYTISANVLKITHVGLKEAMMKRFRQYGAIRNVLDAGFGKKLQKTQATVKDVVL